MDQVLSQLKTLSATLHLASHYFPVLATEAAAIDQLIANPDAVQKIYDAVESGIHLFQVLKDNGLSEAYHFLTTQGHREAA